MSCENYLHTRSQLRFYPPFTIDMTSYSIIEISKHSRANFECLIECTPLPCYNLYPDIGKEIVECTPL